MLAVLLFLLFASAIWLSAVLLAVWQLLREQDCDTHRNLSVSELIVRETQRQWLWCSLKTWLAKKPLRLTYQPARVRLSRCEEAARRKRVRRRKAS